MSTASFNKRQKVQVYLRIKPILTPQHATVSKNSNTSVTTVPPTHTQTPITCQFNHVFDPLVKQEEVFSTILVPPMTHFLSGKDALVFAYGATCSGKTYTVQGTPEKPGLLPRTIRYLLSNIQTTNQKLKLSMLEVHNGGLRDLLPQDFSNQPTLKVQMTDNSISNQYFHPISTQAQWTKLLEKGISRRAVSSTQMNDQSSRSHCIYHLQLWDQDGCISNLSVIDLAGSERSSKTGAAHGSQTQAETSSINASLTALHDLISGTGQSARSHILTQIISHYFKDASSHVTMICNVNPSPSEFDECVASLRWAAMATKVTTQSTINTGSNDKDKEKEILRLTRENVLLRDALKKDQTESSQLSPSVPSSSSSSSLLKLTQSNQIFCDQQEQALFEKYQFIVEQTKHDLQKQFSTLLFDQLRKFPALTDRWNAHTGKDDSYDELIEHFHSLVAQEYHDRYQAQITKLATQNGQLLEEVTQLTDDLDFFAQRAQKYHYLFGSSVETSKKQYDKFVEFSASMERFLNDIHQVPTAIVENHISIINPLFEKYEGLKAYTANLEEEKQANMAKSTKTRPFEEESPIKSAPKIKKITTRTASVKKTQDPDVEIYNTIKPKRQTTSTAKKNLETNLDIENVLKSTKPKQLTSTISTLKKKQDVPITPQRVTRSQAANNK